MKECKSIRKFNLKLLINDPEMKEIKTKLREKQENKCFECKAKLYYLDYSVPIRNWRQECWKCRRQTEVVSYIVRGGIGNSVIGSHEKFDKILAKDIMRTNVVSVDSRDSLESVTKVFTKYPYRRLPVLKDKKVVGVITRRDIIADFLGGYY